MFLNDLTHFDGSILFLPACVFDRIAKEVLELMMGKYILRKKVTTSITKCVSSYLNDRFRENLLYHVKYKILKKEIS